ncbi:MAG: TIGR00282 family metallophosphoesterase [Acidobacteria bacterium]|nr:TIGR00282 family metallophosphoesterase [Acidobacteriota bacterium]
MRILFIGDIFASAGRKLVAEHLPYIQESERIDLVIANAENAAGGFGLTPVLADELFRLGIDVLTSGNHIWDRKEIYEYFARQPRLLRPANYPSDLPGSGLAIAQARNGSHCAVLNLQGRTHMPATECPFRKADAMLAGLDSSVKVRFVDFHAELTSEKMAMGWHLDGRVSAVIGTHTHVPTADTRILPHGTAYQTDAGMTGPYDSVIGVEKDSVLRKFLTSLPVRFDAAKGNAQLHAVVIEADEHTGQSVAAKRYVVRQDGNAGG